MGRWIFLATCFALGWFLADAVRFAAHGRDLGQWSNNDPEISQWYRTLMQPDNPSMSCCGEADAWWCDDISVKDGHVFCAITDDREDAPRRRPHIDVGTKFEIPPHKMKWGPNDAQPRKDWTTGQPVPLNPTGHAIIFLSTGGFVYCFVPAGGV